MLKINNEACMAIKLSVQIPVSNLVSSKGPNDMYWAFVPNNTKYINFFFFKPQKSLTKLEDLYTFVDLENCQFEKKKKKANSFFITNHSKSRYRKPNNSPIACTSSIHVNSYAYDEIQHNKHSRLLTTDLVMLL